CGRGLRRAACRGGPARAGWPRHPWRLVARLRAVFRGETIPSGRVSRHPEYTARLGCRIRLHRRGQDVGFVGFFRSRADRLDGAIPPVYTPFFNRLGVRPVVKAPVHCPRCAEPLSWSLSDYWGVIDYRFGGGKPPSGRGGQLQCPHCHTWLVLPLGARLRCLAAFLSAVLV